MEDKIKAICAELAEMFGSPCNFTPPDEFMLDNGCCEDCCGEIPDEECWERYFETKLKWR